MPTAEEIARDNKRVIDERVKQLQENQRSGIYNPKRTKEELDADAAKVARENKPRSSVAATGFQGKPEESSLGWEDTGHGGEAGALSGPRTRVRPAEESDAKNEEGQEDHAGDAGDVREEEGQAGILREHQQGEDLGDGDSDGAKAKAEGKNTYVVQIVSAKTKEEILKRIKDTKGFVSATQPERVVRWYSTVTVKL